MDDVLTIEALRNLCDDENIILTSHLVNRARERCINYDDIKNVIISGEIIESYDNDYPYPSCLVLGLSIQGKNIHVVAGIGHSKLWIITAYYPSNKKWENDGKTRKGGKV